jgi:hypothetical protein
MIRFPLGRRVNRFLIRPCGLVLTLILRAQKNFQAAFKQAADDHYNAF